MNHFTPPPQATISELPEIPAQTVAYAVPSQPDPMLALIERVAKDPEAAIDKLERLFALHRESQAIAAKTAYNAAMARVQARLTPVRRDAVNSQTNSPYARLETISDAITPIITAEGFALSFDTADCPTPNHMRIVCHVTHAAGHSESRHFDLGLDNVGIKGNPNKTLIQASGSTISYARRYLKLMVFDVALTNEDRDGNRNKLTSGNQDAELAELHPDVWHALKDASTHGSGALAESWRALSNDTRKIIVEQHGDEWSKIKLAAMAVDRAARA